jgi:hypothetical protein
MFDTFLSGLNKGDILNDGTFSLMKKVGNNEMKEVEFRGSWLLCDNGYPSWPCLVPPLKDPITYQECHFSEWLESMRKDVECTFGILKGGFRILKTGIRLHGIEATDLIWLTCCALHNMFLEEDGLSDKWENGIATDWESELGLHNSNDVLKYCPRFAIRRLKTPDERRKLDLSGNGFGTDKLWDVPEENEDDDYSISTFLKQEKHDCRNLNVQSETRQSGIVLNSLKLHTFRNYLVEHFDYKFRLKLLKWPSRLKLNSYYGNIEHMNK